MSERCYACQIELVQGDDVAQLVEEDGTKWLVHVRCLNAFEKADDES